VTNLITPRALFSPVFLQSCSVIHESGSDNSFRRHGHFRMSPKSKMAASRHLGFGLTGSRSIRSADFENPTLEPNMKWIGWPVADYGSLKFSKMWGRSVGRSVVDPQYTPWSNKKQDTKLLSITSLNNDRFSNSFTVTLSRKFAIKKSLQLPPHLNIVAILPCEILMSDNIACPMCWGTVF